MKPNAENKFLESLEAELSDRSCQSSAFAAVLRGGESTPLEEHCCKECEETHNAKLAL